VELKFIAIVLDSILGITPYEKLRAQNDKNSPKLVKIASTKIAMFLYIFRIYSLKIFQSGGLGVMA